MTRAADRKYVVANADEGDSGTFADRMIFEGDPFMLIEGMAIAAYAVGATKGFIYLRSEYPHAAKVMDARAPHIAETAGWIGPDAFGPGKHFDLELRLGAGAYICGEETSLLESLEGKRALVRAKPPLPAVVRPVRQADADQQRADASPPSPISSPRAATAYADYRHGPFARHPARPARRQYLARRAD